MPNISASVGEGGRNKNTDVKIVQRLLNNHLAAMGRVHPLADDGVIGEKTLGAIFRFQSWVVGMRNPDRRVDPGGLTLRVLRGASVTFIKLPKDGGGYYSYSPARNQFGTRSAISSIRGAARKTRLETGFGIGIGDISLAPGGRMPPHSSHRFGVDVDVRPLRIDGEKRSVTIHNAMDYDRAATRKLVQLLRQDPNLKFVLFNDPQIEGVSGAPGHHNHLHVRYKK